MENGAIPDESITASSSTGPVPPHFARLNGLLAWCTGKAEDCYLQVRLIGVYRACTWRGALKINCRSNPVELFEDMRLVGIEI